MCVRGIQFVNWRFCSHLFSNIIINLTFSEDGMLYYCISHCLALNEPDLGQSGRKFRISLLGGFITREFECAHLPVLKVAFLMVISVPRNGESAAANAAGVGFVTSVCAHVRDHGGALESIEPAPFTFIAGGAVILGRCVQVN